MSDEAGHPRSVTLAEVARRAHVSASVVSKVVNARPGVSPETRARVHEVLHELSYTAQRNVAARSRLVDVVVPDLHSSWMNQLMTGMHAAARESGVALVVTVESSQAWMSGAAARGTSGVIRVLVPFREQELAWLRTHDVPFAEVSSRRAEGGDVPLIEAEHELAGAQATDELIKHGHTRILYAGGRGTAADALRRSGYLAAMQRAGLEPRTMTEWSLYRAADAMRDASEIHRPTAVVAWADQIALAIMHEAHRLGMTLPRDLSVIGFDDLPEASSSHPRLTTVRVPLQEMGAAALRSLLSADGPPDQVLFSTSLVRRESVTEPPTPFSRPAPGR